MKQKIIATFVSIGLLFCSIAFTRVYAQEETPTPVFDFGKAYQDFVFNFDKYRAAHDEYELARSQYLQSNTLASQANAQEKTYNMLFDRDEALKTYLTMLRMRLGAAVGVSHDRREFLFTRIDREYTWFDDHQSNLSSAASLADQVADSSEAKSQYDKTTEVLIYDVLTDIAIGKTYFLRQKQQSLIFNFESKLAQIRTDGETDTAQIERWLIETKNRITRSEEKEADILKQQLEIPKSKARSQLFNQIQLRVNESLQYLKEANDFLLEIVKTIRNG